MVWLRIIKFAGIGFFTQMVVMGAFLSTPVAASLSEEQMDYAGYLVALGSWSVACIFADHDFENNEE